MYVVVVERDCHQAHMASASSETARTAGIALCSLGERLKTESALVRLVPRLYRACLAAIYTEAERQIFRQIACHLLDDEEDEAQVRVECTCGAMYAEQLGGHGEHGRGDVDTLEDVDRERVRP